MKTNIKLINSILILFICSISGFSQANNKPEKCILVFGSHADDVEEIAGGTFAKYIAEGYKGVYVCVMNNLSGNQIGTSLREN